ncbi:NAD(+) kinase [Candidatus Riesia pediculicola]|uniref:NAD kinase n=2 Tax=Candidatus Riesia pediculicola TaxID=401619 RepID=D4G8B2_RIEPU|nr:NAD(+) kinase [Candidatus Riesia pediculicola]ADD79460.1 probable inorganic polyphosphate/ATP-NAD kinase (Poly(P)/ATP NAD kinase) [Candidatus Riesia pediculicola USDA]QOJ86440.1 NAD(+) kinase [Candidatus Riesia pediculicola]
MSFQKGKIMLNKKIKKASFFKNIGIVGYFKQPSVLKTFKNLCTWLKNRNYRIMIEDDDSINTIKRNKNIILSNIQEMGEKSDLIIVIGGDGSMLNAIRNFSKYEQKIIGINHGNLGFLNDLHPKDALNQLSKILNGSFHQEKRFLLEIQINKKKKEMILDRAINEISFNSRKIKNMIDFEVFINKNLAFFQRSNGLIISTPTGSTAYSLSVGGPILSPNLNAILLVSIFPHSISSRPLLVHGNSCIQLKIKSRKGYQEINCDGQIVYSVSYGDKVLIKKSNYKVNLLHPKRFNYFKILKSKLGWGKL